MPNRRGRTGRLVRCARTGFPPDSSTPTACVMRSQASLPHRPALASRYPMRASLSYFCPSACLLVLYARGSPAECRAAWNLLQTPIKCESRQSSASISPRRRGQTIVAVDLATLSRLRPHSGGLAATCRQLPHPSEVCAALLQEVVVPMLRQRCFNVVLDSLRGSKRRQGPTATLILGCSGGMGGPTDVVGRCG